jgi:Tol biopolymer transport system component
MRYSCIALLLLLVAGPLRGQLGATGGNHPELHWSEFKTEHFLLVYHQGLDTVAKVAASVAEEAYRVVTTNLRTPLTKRISIYLSDHDEVKNAFAFDDDHIFIWMRGILDDGPFGFRSSGTSKWLRAVITHEFTHIVIAHATKDWTSFLFPLPKVPRWFNEGTARFMEADGWTADLDALLRVATVSGTLNLGESDDFLAGGMLYEGGQSFVRYIAANYGDSALPSILKAREGAWDTYSFEKAIKKVTNLSLSELRHEWFKRLNVYFNTAYGQKEETADFSSRIQTGIDLIFAARLSPDGNRLVAMGKRSAEAPTNLYISPPIVDTAMQSKRVYSLELLSDELGFEPSISWFPDGKAICLSKYRIGSDANLLHDLYRVSTSDGSLERLTTDGRFEQPDVSPKDGRIVAVHTEKNGSDLYIMNADGSDPKQLTSYNDPLVQVNAPRWSPDGLRIAFTLFDKNGKRDIAVIYLESRTVTLPMQDSAIDRSPVWIGNDVLAFTSHRNGVPNIWRVPVAGGICIQMTDVAGAVFAWDYSAAKDSILISSFDDRNKIQLRWFSARRSVVIRDSVTLKDDYTSWRTVRFPLVMPGDAAIPKIAINEPTAYNSFLSIKPFAAAPIATSDKGDDGQTGIRWGIIATAFDPMQKHVLSAFVDYGTESGRFGGFINYLNNQLRQTISVSGGTLYTFARSIVGHPYYERSQLAQLAIGQVFNAPDALSTNHLVSISATFRQLEPMNLFELGMLSPNYKPIPFKGIELGLNYAYAARDMYLKFITKHTDEALNSDLTLTKAMVNFGYRIPFSEERNVFLGFRALSIAQFGAQIPQEFLGFSTDEVFERGFSLTSLETFYRLRGIRRPGFGDRLAIGTAEIIVPDFLVSGFVPLVRAFEPSLVGFFDIGNTWYEKRPANFTEPVETRSLSKVGWLKSFGVELRAGQEGIFLMGGGVGWEIRKGGSAPDWYFRISTTF